MTKYILFLVSGVLNLYLLLLYLGFSAGFSSYLPVFAILGALLLFAICPWLTLYKPKIGSLVGLICLMPIVLWHLAAIVNGVFNSSKDNRTSAEELVVFSMLFVVAALASLLAVKTLREESVGWDSSDKSIKHSTKLILLLIPAALVVFWVVSLMMK